MLQHLRNVAIIAHVDHGKTTLVIERERGITILAKNTALIWNDYRINIVDTPGHADFGGEVERVLSMVDSVLLLVDAVDGPMPQTRFVTQKAFALGLKPIVVINKIDRSGARPHWVLDQTFELFDRLGATDQQLDFPVVYTSALNGTSSLSAETQGPDMTALFQAIVDFVPSPPVDPDGPFRMQISTLDYSSYVGVIGIGRIARGTAHRNMPVTVVPADGDRRSGRVLQILGFHGLERTEIEEASAGDIVAVTGLETLDISDTLCNPAAPEALPPLTVDQPTVSMTFQVNMSPLAGKDGKYLTSRQIRERLLRELKHNVALHVAPTEDPDKFRVSGRGELHLSILIENMRREGYELAVSRPEVIVRTIDEQRCEPFELLTVDVEEAHQGGIMEALGARRAELLDMQPDSQGRVRIDYQIPARGLIGFQTEYLTLTRGTGLLHHVFDHYGPCAAQAIAARRNGVLVANGAGKSLGFALFNLQERGRLFIGPGEDIYEGMVIGIHSRNNDLVVNPLKAKQLTNVRASGTDENIMLTPPTLLTLEQALEFIDDDELVEVTPKVIRIRKKFLKEHERKKAARGAA